MDPTQGSGRHDLGRGGGVGGVLRRRARDRRPAPPAGDRRGATGRPAAAVGGRHPARAAPLVVRGRAPDVRGDLPGRLLAAAVAALPERRREWGRAMTAELAEVQGRSPAGELVGGRRGGARAEGVRGDLHRPGRCDGGPGRRPLAPAAAAAAGAGCDRAGDRWRGRLDRRNRDPPAPGAGRGAVPAAAVGGVSRRRTRRLPVDRPWIATVAGHQPARTPPRRRRCCVRGLVLAGDPHRRDRAPAPSRAPVGANLPEALVFCLGIFPVLGLTLG